jgi:hypothetical protein
MNSHIVLIGAVVVVLVLAGVFIALRSRKPAAALPKLSILSGTSLDFDRVKKPSQDMWLRTLSIAVENQGAGPAPNCSLIAEWTDDAGAKKSHPLAGDFILLPTKKRFFPLASYNEAQAVAAESRKILLHVEQSGQDGHALKPQAPKKHPVTLRLTSPAVAEPLAFSCALYVDGTGRLKLEKA